MTVPGFLLAISPSTIDGYRRIQKNRFSSVMGLPIDAKTDWHAVCNSEALLCSPKALRNAFRFIVSVLGENGINAPKATFPPLNTNMRKWLEPEQIQKLIHLFDCNQKSRSDFSGRLSLFLP